MNYLFVMPSSTKIKTQAYVFPIGIAYVSASLKATGRNVITLNLNYKEEGGGRRHHQQDGFRE